MALSLFGRKAAPDRALVEQIRAWAAAALGGDPETRFSINEIICRDPACPGTETVILVMEPGQRTRALKIARAIADVVEADVRAACEPPPP